MVAKSRRKKAKLLRRKNGQTAPVLSLNMSEVTVGEMRFVTQLLNQLRGILKYKEARSVYDKMATRLTEIEPALEIGGKKKPEGKKP